MSEDNEKKTKAVTEFYQRGGGGVSHVAEQTVFLNDGPLRRGSQVKPTDNGSPQARNTMRRRGIMSDPHH